MKRSLRFLTIVACSVVLGCEREVAGPERVLGPGPLELQVATPNADDGALLLAVSGGPVDSVTLSEFEVTALEVAAGDYRVLIHGGSIARVWVRDRGTRSAYVASVAQAVSRSTYERRAIAGYAVIITAGR